jgi:hypothetical protein
MQAAKRLKVLWWILSTPWLKCSTLSGRQKNIIHLNGRQVRPPETGVIRIQLLPESLVHSIIYIRPAVVAQW